MWCGSLHTIISHATTDKHINERQIIWAKENESWKIGPDCGRLAPWRDYQFGICWLKNERRWHKLSGAVKWASHKPAVTIHAGCLQQDAMRRRFALFSAVIVYPPLSPMYTHYTQILETVFLVTWYDLWRDAQSGASNLNPKLWLGRTRARHWLNWSNIRAVTNGRRRFKCGPVSDLCVCMDQILCSHGRWLYRIIWELCYCVPSPQQARRRRLLADRQRRTFVHVVVAPYAAVHYSPSPCLSFLWYFSLMAANSDANPTLLRRTWIFFIRINIYTTRCKETRSFSMTSSMENLLHCSSASSVHKKERYIFVAWKRPSSHRWTE